MAATRDTTAAAPPAQDAPSGSRRRRRVFAAIAACLPILLLLGAEGVSRLCGFGGYPPVVRLVGSDGPTNWYTTFRPGVDSFFYTQRSQTGGMREWHFITPKPPGTVRILFLGGSAMQGWPQPRPLANDAFLEAMLTELWNDGRRPEVLNFGATAMASFPAVHFLREMLDHELDLVVVMSGNNEFYGAYGVSSLHSAGTSPAGMRFMRWVRGLGLTQWIADITAPDAPSDADRRLALMQRVAVNQQVGPDDRLRAAAETTLRAHLTQIVEMCNRHDIPVVVCTLPTNERGLAPVGADVAPDVGPQEAARFEALLARGRDATDPQEAADALREAIELYGKNAESHFLRARALERLGRDAEAHVEYLAARDFDTMPWRATSGANAIARSMAEKGSTLCDMEAAFRAASPHNAIGWELLDDHVHMSVEGQVLFARTLATTMTQLPMPLSVDADRLALLPDAEAFIARAGRNAFTDYEVAWRMTTLFDIPFLARSNPEARQTWHERCDGLRSTMSDLDRLALQQWRDPGLHLSKERPLCFVAGYNHLMAGDYAGALPLLESARASLAKVSLWRLQLGWYIIKCRRALHPTPTDEDRAICQETLEIGRLLEKFVGFPDPQGPMYLGLVYHAVGAYPRAIAMLDDTVRFVRGAEGAEAVYALADSLIKTGDRGRARKLLNLALKDEDFAETARELLTRLDALESGDGD